MASSNAAGTSGAKESSLTTLISRLARGNIPYFYKVMTKTAVTQLVLGPVAYALGFPVSFVRAQGNNFCEKATFQRTNCDQTWPIKITVKEEQTPKHDPVIRVFAYGAGGWKDFVVDNHIQVGDTLVFSLVGYSRFMIDIIKAVPAEGQEEEEDLSVNASAFPKHIEEALVPCRKVPPQDGPRFWVTVAPPEVNQLGVPAYFWKHLNHDMLPSRDWQLKGPNGAVMLVEAEGSFYEQKMDMHLKSGWKEFFVENNLRIGHLLEFSQIGRHCFTVDVHDSDCKRFQRFAGVDLFSG